MRTTSSTPPPARGSGEGSAGVRPALPAAEQPKTARKRPPRRPAGFGVAAGAVVAFLAILAVLAIRMSTGKDPALGADDPGGQGLAAAKLKRPVIHRRVVKLRVVHDPPAAQSAAPGTASLAIAPAPASSPAAPAPAPTPASPSPSPAPAPAPAPSPPPVTSSS